MDGLANTSCAFGVFDGFHLGHKFIIDETIRQAKSVGCESAIITFDVDPDSYFKIAGFKAIMSNEMRINTLMETGVDKVFVLDFNALHSLDAACFLDTIFKDNAPGVLNVGNDIKFGSAAKGDINLFNIWGSQNSMQVKGYELLESDGCPITSSRIRALLDEGRLDDANMLLGHPYAVSQQVVHGRGEGADMGFRTANIELPADLDVLKDGVYAACAIVDGTAYKAAVSVGVSPTFESESNANIEAHILGFSGDLYGMRVELEFVRRLRDMIKFDDVDTLIAQVNQDIEFVNSSVSI